MAGDPAADRQALAAVPQAAPAAGGILADQPRVLARPTLPGTPGVADRCALYPGDLFAPPPAADLYLLASVLHDWDDDHTARILTALSRGATSDSACGSSRCCCPPTPSRTGPS